jgi:hypothetical protein
MKLVNTLQDMQKEQQIMAAACFFTLLYRYCFQDLGMSALELLSAADRMMYDAEDKRREFKAAELYIQHELL